MHLVKFFELNYGLICYKHKNTSSIQHKSVYPIFITVSIYSSYIHISFGAGVFVNYSYTLSFDIKLNISLKVDTVNI